ncbi:MerR family transcriptional regulator, partial [Pseudobutyrivibrio sp.]
GCIKSALARLDENPDWDDIADIIKKMEMSQGADERRWYAADHAADGIEWYEKIFNSMSFKESDTVLDLGCSYGLLWRKNWKRIPSNFSVEGYDIHGNWADDLYEYLNENRASLPKGSDIQVIFSNLEKSETWEKIKAKKYSKIIAHYLLSYLNDEKTFIANVAQVLAKGGMFSVNHYGEAAKEYDYWEKVLDEAGVDKTFALKKRAERRQMDTDFEALLSEHFERFEKISLPGPLIFESAEALFDRMLKKYPEGRKYLEDNKRIIEEYFDNVVLKDGPVAIDMDSVFYHCYK